MIRMDNPAGVLLNLPADMHYLIAPALRYGKYIWDDEIFDFLNQASEAEMTELAAVAERVLWNDDYQRVNAFLDEHPMTETEEAARLYYLFLVMDYADLKFDCAPED
jgi:hypothetical protein